MKTLQRVKVQHEIVQYIKRVQHEKKCNMKRLLHKNCNVEMVQYEESAAQKECHMKKVQHEKNTNCHSEIRKKLHKNSALWCTNG